MTARDVSVREKAAAVLQCRMSWAQASTCAVDLENAGLLAEVSPRVRELLDEITRLQGMLHRVLYDPDNHITVRRDDLRQVLGGSGTVHRARAFNRLLKQLQEE